jgi:hypothetical protein
MKLMIELVKCIGKKSYRDRRLFCTSHCGLSRPSLLTSKLLLSLFLTGDVQDAEFRMNAHCVRIPTARNRMKEDYCLVTLSKEAAKMF